VEFADFSTPSYSDFYFPSPGDFYFPSYSDFSLPLPSIQIASGRKLPMATSHIRGTLYAMFPPRGKHPDLRPTGEDLIL